MNLRKLFKTTDLPHPETRSTVVYAEDDLMTRAEKITALFVSGATGGYAVNVFRVLQKYAELDAEARVRQEREP